MSTTTQYVKKINGYVIKDEEARTSISTLQGNLGDLRTALDTALEKANAAIPSSQKGVANGVASLGSDGKVPSSQLPSYVDDVLEAENKAAFPTSGESGKIYVAKDTNLTYRWSGSAYVEISPSLALGETSSTAYAGNKGKANADAIAALQTTVAGKANSSHTHTVESITNLQDALDAKANSSHTHTIANVTNLQSSLDAKAPKSHSHAISDITNLQSTLDRKSNASHAHPASGITFESVTEIYNANNVEDCVKNLANNKVGSLDFDYDAATESLTINVNFD